MLPIARITRDTMAWKMANVVTIAPRDHDAEQSIRAWARRRGYALRPTASPWPGSRYVLPSYEVSSSDPHEDIVFWIEDLGENADVYDVRGHEESSFAWREGTDPQGDWSIIRDGQATIVDPYVVEVIEDLEEGELDEGVSTEDEQLGQAVSRQDIETIDRYRASIGMGPIDPSAGWTPAELHQMAENIRTTGRMANVGQLKRRLTQIPRSNPPASVRLRDLSPGTQIMLSTVENRHPFSATVVSQKPHSTFLQSTQTFKTPKGRRHKEYEVVYAHGDISHLVRYPLARGAFPRESRILDWNLVT